MRWPRKVIRDRRWGEMTMSKSKGVCGPMWASETAKIRKRVEQYCKGKVMDIGCGPDKFKPDAFGLDSRGLPGVNYVLQNNQDIYRLHELLPDHVGQYDTVFSSHCLEHIPNDFAALGCWSRFLKPGGYLVLYLPDEQYDNVWNVEHFHIYNFHVFKRRFLAHYKNMSFVGGGEDHGHDRYSFWFVARKL